VLPVGRDWEPLAARASRVHSRVDRAGWAGLPETKRDGPLTHFEGYPTRNPRSIRTSRPYAAWRGRLWLVERRPRLC